MAKADRAGAGSEAKAPAAGVLVAAVSIAAISGLWSLFQWTELAAARAGAEVFCGFGRAAGSSSQCAQAWATPFAVFVHRATGLPVAGWGLVWSATALALPLGALARRANGRSHEPLWSATLLTALAGVVASMGLASVLLVSGQLCATCVLTYALVLAYAAVCLSQGVRLAAAAPGAGLAAGAAAAAFAVLLVPGLRTAGIPPGGGGLADAPLPAPRPAQEVPDSAPTDAALREYLETLPLQGRQAIADALARWIASPATPVRAPRALIGPATAPVRITEFADTLCGHCADLHRTLSEIRLRVPPESFAIEPRQFPLDGSCNPQIELAAPDPVRCTAARAMICLEGMPGAFAFASALFENQRGLDEARVFEAAEPYLSESALRSCLESPQTAARLQADIDWAVERGIRGTPFVLVNGRQALALPPFLYALILAGGDPGHPGFAVLPPPSRSASRG